MAPTLKTKAQEYLFHLCNEIPNRRVGSEGNRLATAFFAEKMQSFGLDVECPEFECMDWQTEGATISVDGKSYGAQVSPYSLGIQANSPLVVASSVDELEDMDFKNKILFMGGELTREQFMPKSFPFFQVEEQQRIIQILEGKRPSAIITATTRNPEMAGALYPFPVFEDGDFDIPSVFITKEQGNELARYAGSEIFIEIRAERIPARACNVVARKRGSTADRIVLFAHIDAKLGTPGALDNGTGIVVLILLGELLKDYKGKKSIEIIALNGEDYYSNPGEQLYISQNTGRFEEVSLGINIDGLGYSHGKTAYSTYGCQPEMAAAIRNVFSSEELFIAGEPWYQGDHAIFLMNQRPALALTSERVYELMAEIVHTDRDTPKMIDPEKVAAAAMALHRLLTHM